MSVTKVSKLLPYLWSQPAEFYDRVMKIFEERADYLWQQPPSYNLQDWDEIIQGLEESLETKLDGFLNESALADVEGKVHQRTQEMIEQELPFFHLPSNAAFTLARLCYALTRAVKPAIVLETGVAYGVTSAFFLKAIEVNGHGRLHSVDLPYLKQGADQTGILIPETLKQHWQLHRGVSRRVLPQILPQVGKVDIFIHDSLHTYMNMRREFRLVAPYLKPRSIVMSDDVESNCAFGEWVTQSKPNFSAVMKTPTKKNLFGVSVFTDRNRKDR